MSEIKKLVKEIRQTLRKILVFDIFIESVLVYLCLYIFLMVFNLYQKYAIFVGIGYFIFMLLKRKDLSSIKTVEKKYPILNEALTTANDTIDQDNYVVNQLRTYVKSNVSKVTASSFLDAKGDILKIGAVISLVFIIISMSICQGTSETCRKVFNTVDVQRTVSEIDMEEVMDKIKNINSKDDINMSTFNLDKQQNTNTKRIELAKSNIATLGDDEIKIQIRLSSDQIDINDVNDYTTEKEFAESSISSIGVTGDSSFEENIKREHKELVKDYFNTIR